MRNLIYNSLVNSQITPSLLVKEIINYVFDILRDIFSITGRHFVFYFQHRNSCGMFY